MTFTSYLAFQTPHDLSIWLKANNLIMQELWVRIYKKQSGTASVTWEDCVKAALAWGWIDGQRQSLDEVSFLQRLTPRRRKSNWSKKNCDLAERLIADGRMQPAGLAHIQAAQADGRWDNAYAGSSGMVMPADFFLRIAKERQHESVLRHVGSDNLIHNLPSSAHRQTSRNPRKAHECYFNEASPAGAAFLI